MLGEYCGGKGGGGKPARGGARNTSRLVASLTCLQFAFAIYATFLLYYKSPAVDLRVNVKPDLAWATRIAQHWKQIITTQPGGGALSPEEVCEHESIDFEQKKSTDVVMIRLKRKLYDEVLAFQRRSFGTEKLPELLRMRSRWSVSGPNVPRVTVILNHFKRRTLCAQLEQLRRQTLPFHRAWVLSFDSPNEASLRRIVESYNDSRVSFVASGYDFNYRKFRSKEAGLYLPDPAYDITVDRIVQVDFLSSSWFLPTDLVKTLFIETPFTFMTGEDLHLSYQLQKYMGAGSFVLPVDPNDKETWGDSEHRLAYVSETTVIFKDIVQVRDEQWWRALTSGYVTRWAAMHPQKVDALFYAHSLGEYSPSIPSRESSPALCGELRARACREAAQGHRGVQDLDHSCTYHDKLFFCDDERQFLRRAPWLVMRTDDYFVPPSLHHRSDIGTLNVEWLQIGLQLGDARVFFNAGDTATIQSSSFGDGVRVTMDMLNQAFLEGMEEANKFLPFSTTTSIFGLDATSREHLPIRDGSMVPRVFALPNTNSVADGRVSGRGCKEPAQLGRRRRDRQEEQQAAGTRAGGERRAGRRRVRQRLRAVHGEDARPGYQQQQWQHV
ncbi:unnamed protein product [Miscanthus lutarioriparius]|uniref:Fucosyltransferase n=1 Tax=Miscanthus lutarioriparius TaxID=422564 RepID=A0A811QET0_9POAL|nr:unnamed protein product [Miscanthus lutarioriparius]